VNVLIFLLLLSALVFVHELGHFMLAKRAGVKVEEFGIGFPPRLLSFRRGETVYSLNAVPLGGFVRMLGEEDPTEPRSFASAPRPWRVAILAAGATMNILAAVFLFAGAFASGWPTVTKSEVIINQVSPDSPAATAGLQPGDVIVAVNGKPIEQSGQLRQAIDSSLGKSIALNLNRSGKDLSIQVSPRSTWPSGQGPIGIGIEDHPLKREPIKYSILRSLYYGAEQTAQTLLLTINIPIMVARGILPLDVARPIGPIGIYQVTSQAVTETVSTGWWYPILFDAATISAGLGLANLLPIPGLDGGRLLFVFVEAIRGRRINPRRETMIHFLGLAFLVSLVLVVTYFDVLFPINVNFSPP
jgi:regulator of sigma E protease